MSELRVELADIICSLDKAVASGDLGGITQGVAALKRLTEVKADETGPAKRFGRALAAFKAAETDKQRQVAAFDVFNAIYWDEIKQNWARACKQVVNTLPWVESGSLSSTLLPECEITGKTGRVWVCTFTPSEEE